MGKLIMKEILDSNPGEKLIAIGHLNMYLDGVFFGTPMWLLRFRVAMVILCLLAGIIDLCVEFKTFFTNIWHVKYLELYLIFVYFVCVSFLRPRTDKFIAIVRSFLFFIVVLQVTIIYYWI